MLKTLMNPVSDRPIIKQRSKHLFHRHQHIVDTDNIQKGFLLTGKGCVGQIFGSSRRTHSHRSWTRLGHLLIRITHVLLKGGRKWQLNHPTADIRADSNQFRDVFHIQGSQGGLDTLIKAVMSQKSPKSIGSGRKAIRDSNANTCQITDHLPKGGIFATDFIYIGHAQGVEPANVFGHHFSCENIKLPYQSLNSIDNSVIELRW